MENLSEKPLVLCDLPNEVIVLVLSLFGTHDLLPLTVISKQFHKLILRILHFRLLLAASAPEYKIILEAYLPSRRYTRPYLFCEYLGTDGLSSKIEGKGSIYEDCVDENGDPKAGGRLTKLGGLYSRFRPELPGVEGSIPVRRIAGAAPNLASNTSGLNLDWHNAPTGSANAVPVEADTHTNSVLADVTAVEGTPPASTESTQQIQEQVVPAPGLPMTQPIWRNGGDGGARKVVYQLHVDAEELFSQFCAAASLVRLGPRRGVFLSSVPLVEDKQGVIRVWKQWLLDRAKESTESEGVSPYELQRTFTDVKPEDIARDKNVLWTTYNRNVGLKLGVREKAIPGIEQRGPDDDKDDIPLCFDIEIKELIVRTTHLMLAVEDSEELLKKPGKALIFGSFAMAM